LGRGLAAGILRMGRLAVGGLAVRGFIGYGGGYMRAMEDWL